MNAVEIGAILGMKFVPFLFALCFHEYAHGWVAKRRGDRTAELSGRLSMNPLVHADPFGTFLFPIVSILFGSGFFFGWAKPVPVNARNLEKPKWDMFWVAAAGPLSNVLLAVLTTIALGILVATMQASGTSKALVELLKAFMQINLFLAVFNLIPIHPLDGGKVIEPFIPYEWNRWMENNAHILSMALFAFILLGGRLLAIPVQWLNGQLLQISILIGTSLT